MIFRRDAEWARHAPFIADQRHDMARAGLFHRLFKPRQGANVNHGQITVRQGSLFFF
jgi:hypothetical protein